MEWQIRCFPYGERSAVPRLQQVEQKAVGRQRNQLKGTINDANMFSALDHTTDTEETLVKQPSDDIQTSSKPIPKPRKAKRGETTRLTKLQTNQKPSSAK